MAGGEIEQLTCRLDAVDLQALGRVASVVAGEVRAGDVLLLEGPLASGKTAFVRLLASQMGSRDQVSSPTYTLAHTYSTDRAPVLHIDAYRLSGVAEYLDLGLEDHFPDHVTVVEWGSKISAVHSAYLEVRFAVDHADSALRVLELSADSSRWGALFSALASDGVGN